MKQIQDCSYPQDKIKIWLIDKTECMREAFFMTTTMMFKSDKEVQKTEDSKIKTININFFIFY